MDKSITKALGKNKFLIAVVQKEKKKKTTNDPERLIG